MIAITMGDAHGIGPELVLRAYAAGELPEEVVVVGDTSVLRACAETLKIAVPIVAVAKPGAWHAGQLNVIDLQALTAAEIKPGTISRASGAAAAAYVERATRLALAGEIHAMVTLPINKEATQLSIPRFSGHTEFIAAICGVEDYTMMLASPRLIVTHVSTHVALAEAIQLATTERILTVIQLTHDTLRRWLPVPRIAVAGLNPHAGEHGLFGQEDQRQIVPAIAQANAAGMSVFGPEAPDTVFLRALQGRFDAIVCMYHDQGHIPMKLLDFDHGVNITIGLPIVRTSVDHGTAFDIAWQGKASTASLLAAIDFARKMAPTVAP